LSVMLVVESQIDLGDQVAPVRAKINRRARRLILRVDSLTGIVHITAPSKRSLPDAIKFAQERAGWISEELKAGPCAQMFAEGQVFPYRGEDCKIRKEGGARSLIRINPPEFPDRMQELVVGGDDAHVNRRVTDWLKREARRVLIQQSDYYSDRVGVKRGKIRIGDTRSRWGSCSEDGTLSYSWRLILAPPAILEYVAAHECAHLVHLNHSPAYWRLLASLDVDARRARNWFRDNGAGLFSWGVESEAKVKRGEGL